MKVLILLALVAHVCAQDPPAVSTMDDCVIDVSFILDATGSQADGGLQRQKDFAKAVVDALEPSADGTHIALFVVAGDIDPTEPRATRMVFDLNGGIDATVVKDAIDAVVAYPGAGTNLAAVLELKYDMYNSETGGNRPGVRNTCFLVSDGDTVEKMEAMRFAELLRADGGVIKAIGVVEPGGTNQAEVIKNLLDIAGDMRDVFTVGDLNAAGFVATISMALCDDNTDFCKACLARRNQKDYYANPLNCSEYFHCYYDDMGQIRGILRPCSNGTRWSEGAQACVNRLHGSQDGDAECQEDPCENVQTMIHGYWQNATLTETGDLLENCGIYYRCSNYYSLKMCCPKFHAWDADKSECVKDQTCTSHHDNPWCFGNYVVPWEPPVLDLEEGTCYEELYKTLRREHPDTDQKYQDFVVGDGWVDMPCARNTKFVLQICKCSDHSLWTDIPTPKPDCILHLDCDNEPIEDKSINKYFVDNGGEDPVTVENERCYFTAKDHLEVPGVQGNALGEHFFLSFDFMAECNGDGNVLDGTLFSNRGHINSQEIVPPSLLVHIEGGQLKAGVRTMRQSLLDTLVHTIQCGVRYEVVLIYDQDEVSLWVDCVQVDTEVGVGRSVVFWMNHCPLAIGNDNVYGSYSGWIDNVHLCRDKRNMQDECQSETL